MTVLVEGPFAFHSDPSARLVALRKVVSWDMPDDELESLLGAYEEFCADVEDLLPTRVEGNMGEGVACICEEKDSCGIDADCECVDAFGNFFSSSGTLDVDALPPSLPLVECGPGCACSAQACQNRTSQRGIQCPLQLRTTSRGLGLFASDDVARGTFLCLYAGELVNSVEATRRWRDRLAEGLRDNYILTLRENGTTLGHVDPTRKGNIGRFLNHSCDPNCIVELVRWGAAAIPRPAVFANRSIEAGAELTYDYGNASGQGTSADRDGPGRSERDDSTRTRCLCGSASCRGYMPFDETLAI